MVPVTAVVEAAAAAITVCGVLYSTGKFTARVEENTRATTRLTAAFDKHADKTDARLDDHEKRITVVETVINHKEKR